MALPKPRPAPVTIAIPLFIALYSTEYVKRIDIYQILQRCKTTKDISRRKRAHPTKGAPG